MTKVEQEIEDKGIKYADSLEFTVSKFSDEEGYCWSQVEQAYEKGALDFTKPREDRIEQLSQENADLRDRNQELLESCEGATMMYKDLQKAKELIRTLLLIVDNKASQMEFQLCVADAKQFLNNEVKKNDSSCKNKRNRKNN